MPCASEMSFLDKLISNKTGVDLFLVNGIRLAGTLREHDDVCIIMDSKTAKLSTEQLIYKESVASIVVRV